MVDILEREGDSAREEKTRAMTSSLAGACSNAGSSAACRAVQTAREDNWTLGHMQDRRQGQSETPSLVYTSLATQAGQSSVRALLLSCCSW